MIVDRSAQSRRSGQIALRRQQSVQKEPVHTHVVSQQPSDEVRRLNRMIMIGLGAGGALILVLVAFLVMTISNQTAAITEMQAVTTQAMKVMEESQAHRHSSQSNVFDEIGANMSGGAKRALTLGFIGFLLVAAAGAYSKVVGLVMAAMVIFVGASALGLISV